MKTGAVSFMHMISAVNELRREDDLHVSQSSVPLLNNISGFVIEVM
jgi:hypothetical protein